MTMVRICLLTIAKIGNNDEKILSQKKRYNVLPLTGSEWISEFRLRN